MFPAGRDVSRSIKQTRFVFKNLHHGMGTLILAVLKQHEDNGCIDCCSTLLPSIFQIQLSGLLHGSHQVEGIVQTIIRALLQFYSPDIVISIVVFLCEMAISLPCLYFFKIEIMSIKDMGNLPIDDKECMVVTANSCCVGTLYGFLKPFQSLWRLTHIAIGTT